MAIVRRRKQKAKKIVEKKKTVKVKVKSSGRRLRKNAKAGVSRKAKPVARQEKKEIMGSQEVFVEKTKFYTPASAKVPRSMSQDLPAGYGEDLIILQIRDPWWLHAYWEVIAGTWEKLKEKLGNTFYSAKKVLRVYDVSQVIFNGKNAHKFFDIEIPVEASNWYIDTDGPGRSWCVDLGLRLPSGEFITIVRSNTVHTPLDGPSWITDEEWMIPDDLFARLYGMGFGFGKSSPGKAWQERMKRALFSGVLSSPGITSVSSPGKKPKQRKFWLVVDCELIVYGATEPDAKVSVQGKEIKLRPDGTFTLRFALPDGKQVIPVEAISSDEIEERTITPIVSRETKTSNLVKEKV